MDPSQGPCAVSSVYYYFPIPIHFVFVNTMKVCSRPGAILPPIDGLSTSDRNGGGSFDEVEYGNLEAASDEVSSDECERAWNQPTQSNKCCHDHGNMKEHFAAAAPVGGDMTNLDVTQETEFNTTFDDDTSDDGSSSYHLPLLPSPHDGACANCQQIESEKKKIQHELSMAERAVDLFEGKCQQYLQLIETLESDNDDLQSELDASLKHGNSYAEEILHLGSKIRKTEDQLASFSREFELATEREIALRRKISGLEYTIELLVEDYRKATELYMDAQDDVVKAALNGNVLANECITKVQAENADLEMEFRKISKEWFIAMDKVDFSEKQNQKIVNTVNEKLEEARVRINDLTRNVADMEEKNNLKSKEHDDIMVELTKERDLALSTIEDLAERCKRLVLELENSSLRLIEVTVMKDDAEYTVEVLSNELRDSDAKNVELQSQLDGLKKEKEESEAELLQRRYEAEAIVGLLSDQVLFADEEISRLSSERDALSEQYQAQLQKANERVHELALENSRKDDEYEKLWSKSNNMLFEKEEAIEAAKELQVDVKKTADFIDQRNMLFTEVKSLEHENEQLKQRIVDLIKREHHLKQKNRLLETFLTPSQMSATSKLQNEIESLKKQKYNMSALLDTLDDDHRTEIDTMRCKFQLDLEESQVDFKCKLDAMQQLMELRLEEKEKTIFQLQTQLQGYINENSRLQTDLHLGVLENATIKSLIETLSRLESMSEDQQEELEQKEVALTEKDSIISNLISREKHRESENTSIQLNAIASREFPTTADPHKLQKEMTRLCSKHL